MKSKLLVLTTFFTIIIVALIFPACGRSGSPTTISGETEATEFLGTKLTPINQQRNNALAGTQHIDKTAKTLFVASAVTPNS